MINILCVDDADPIRVVMKSILSTLKKIRVTMADTSDKALGYMMSMPVDVLITDWNMPGRSGLDLVRIVREGQASARIDRFMPIIMLSGHADYESVLKARDAGVDEFIVKPIRPEVVYIRLDSVINNRRPFVQAPGYLGPDRRRRSLPYRGADRRRHVADVAYVD